MGHGLVSLTASLVNVDLSFVFPVANVAITLVGTVVLTLLVLLGPVRRAVRLKPGTRCAMREAQAAIPPLFPFEPAGPSA